MNTINPIPGGLHTLMPHMIIKHALAAIEFYKRTFGAEELSRSKCSNPRGRPSNPHPADRF